MTLIPVLRPQIASAEALLPCLRQIDEARSYTNHGPQERALRAALGRALGDRPEDDVSLFSSGTSALTAAMQDWELPTGSRCLLPAWTFVGSACAIVQAGLEPVLVDVDPSTWCLDPQGLHELAEAHHAKAALIVSPFGASVAYDSLVQLQQSGLKVLVDAAASFDFVQKLATSRRSLPVPLMISLHATKLVSSIEGGAIIVSDSETTQRMVAWSNFGIFNHEAIRRVGTNAKLSEVHAAYGQLSLASWSQTRESLAVLTEAYLEAIGDGLPIEFAPNIKKGLVSSSFNIVLRKHLPSVESSLARANIETRRWWKGGVHSFPAFSAFVSGPLPITDDLARRTLGLPFYHGMTSDDVARVVDALQAACAD